MEDVGLRHRWTLDAGQYFRELRQLKGESRAFDKTSRRSISSAGDGFDRLSQRVGRTGDTLGRVRNRVLGFFAAFSVTRILGELFKFNAGLEATSKRFETMAGSAERATSLIKELREFTATTPFQEGEVFGSAQNLLAFGFEPDQIADQLRTLGDISAGLNIPLNQLAEIYGKIRVQGRLFQEDINQLTGRGIPIIGELAKQFGVTEAEVRKLVETGQVGFENIEAAFQSMTTGAGIFAGLTAELSSTAQGLMSTLIDLARRAAQEVGVGAFELIKEDLQGLVTLLQEARESGGASEVIGELSQAIATLYRIIRGGAGLLVEYGSSITKIIALLAAWRAGIILTNGVTALFFGVIRGGQAILGLFQAGLHLARAGMFALTGQTTAATVAMRGLSFAIKANPIGILVSVILTAVTAFVLFKDRTDELAESQRMLKEEIDANIEALNDMSGAALRSRDAQIFTEIAALGSRRAGILREIIEAENRLNALQPQLDANGQPLPPQPGEDIAGNVDEFRRVSAEIADLRAEDAAAVARVNELNRERLALDTEVNESLTKRLGFLEAIKEELVAAGGEGTIAGFTLASVNQEIGDLTRQIEDLRKTGQSADVSFVPINSEEERRLERFGALLAKLSDEMRIAASGSDAQATAVRALISAEQQLATVQAGILAGGLDETQLVTAQQVRLFLEDQVSALKEQVDSLGRISRLTIEAAQALDTVAPGLLGGTAGQGLTDRLSQQVEAFELQIQTLEALRDSGSISQGAFTARAQQAAEEFREELAEILRLLQSLGLLSNEALVAISKGFADTNRLIGETEARLVSASKSLGLIAGSLRQLSQLGRTFGIVNEGVLSVVDSTAQLFSNLQRVNDAQARLNNLQAQQAAGQNVSAGAISSAQSASLSAGIGAGIGLISAVAGLAKSFNDGVKQRRELAEARRQEMERLEKALRDTTRGFKQAISSLFETFIGQGLTGNQLDTAETLIERLSELSRRAFVQLPRGDRTDQEALREEFAQLFQELQDLGVGEFEGIDELLELINNTPGIGPSALFFGIDNEALGIQFEGLISIIERLQANFGGAADTVEGFIAGFDLLAQFIEQDANTAFETFIGGLIGLGEEVLGPGLLDVLSRIIQGSGALDNPNVSGGIRALFQGLITDLVAGDSSLLAGSDLDQAQLIEIFETILGFIDGAQPGEDGLLDDPTSRSVRFASAITEIQTNEVLAFLEDHAFTLRRIEDLLVVQNSILSGDLVGGAASSATFDFTGSSFGTLDASTVREFSKQFGVALLKASSNQGKVINTSFGKQ